MHLVLVLERSVFAAASSQLDDFSVLPKAQVQLHPLPVFSQPTLFHVLSRLSSTTFIIIGATWLGFSRLKLI